MPTKTGKKTRAEKREENRAAYRAGRNILEEMHQAHLNSFYERARAGGAKIGFLNNPVTVDWLFIGIGEGLTLRAVCGVLKLYVSEVLSTIQQNDELHSRYVRAREAQSEAHADMNDEILLAPLDYEADGSSVELAHRKAIIENRRWLMGKNHVRRFGDKVIVEGGETPIGHKHNHDGEVTVRALADSYGERLKKLR